MKSFGDILYRSIIDHAPFVESSLMLTVPPTSIVEPVYVTAARRIALDKLVGLTRSRIAMKPELRRALTLDGLHPDDAYWDVAPGVIAEIVFDHEAGNSRGNSLFHDRVTNIIRSEVGLRPRNTDKQPPSWPDIMRRNTQLSPDDLPGTGRLIEDQFTDREEVEWLLSHLPPKRRETVEMYYFEDLTERQIGEALGKTTGAIGSAKKKALDQLRELPREE